MLDRQIRRYTVSQHWKACSEREDERQPARAGAAATISVLQPAAGQPEEHVLQRAAPDQRGERLEAGAADRREGVIPVGDVEQDAVSENLGPFGGKIPELVRGQLVPVRTEAQLEHLGGAV